jgi:hypothetical protein
MQAVSPSWRCRTEGAKKKNTGIMVPVFAQLLFGISEERTFNPLRLEMLLALGLLDFPNSERPQNNCGHEYQGRERHQDIELQGKTHVRPPRCCTLRNSTKVAREAEADYVLQRERSRTTREFAASTR